MAFSPTYTSTLSPIAVLVSNNNTLQMEVDTEVDPIAQAIAQAQEQLCIAMEVQQWEEDLWWCMEKGWESQMAERDTVVVLDKKSAVGVAKKAVVVIGMKCQKVSL